MNSLMGGGIRPSFCNSSRMILRILILTVIAILIPPPTKPRPDPDLARGVWTEGDALPPAASSDFGNGAGRLCSAPDLV